MSESISLAGWGPGLQPAGCPHCDWQFLVPAQRPTAACPYCGVADLVPISVEAMPYVRPPEIELPHRVDADTIQQRITKFADQIPYAPDDLNANALMSRLQRVFLPMWLVDLDVTAQYWCEVGYDYQVVSHKEDFRNGQWIKREVKETRQRWEPRLGTIQRHYANTPAPATDGQRLIEARLGAFDLGHGVPFKRTDGSIYKLPNRTPRDAWHEVEPVLQQRAAEDCQRAAEADHQREFRWQTRIGSQNWTHLLLPLYTTYYHDDENQAQMVLLHGQTGRLHGSRRASMRKAQRRALIIAVVAAVLFGLTVLASAIGFFFPPLLAIAAILGIISLLVGAGAFLPIVQAWQFNRQQT